MIKKLLLILMSLLLTAALFTACTYSTKEKEAIQKWEDMQASLPEPDDDAADKPKDDAAEPEPEEEKEEEKEVGFHPTEEEQDGIENAWIPINWELGDFPGHFATYIDYNLLADESYLRYAFQPQDMTEDEALEAFGMKMYMMTPPDLYYNGEWVDEKNADGDPLLASLNVNTYEDRLYVYIMFVTTGAVPIIEKLLERRFPEGIVDSALTDDRIKSQGISYEPQTNDLAVTRLWTTVPGDCLLMYDIYKDKYAGYPEFTLTPAVDDYTAPTMRYLYDIHGDGNKVTTVPVIIEAWDQADMFVMTLGMRHDF